MTTSTLGLTPGVITDSSLVEEYQKLAKDAQARLSAGK